MLILRARSDGLKLRVRGAGHSQPAAFGAGPRALAVMLDKFSAVEFDEDKMQVRVEAGCHLGLDPEDPTSTSTWKNSLFAQLDARGWALPDMGGITRQTVGGFLSTGSSGGSLLHSPGDLIVSLRLMDGTGTIREFSKSTNPDDPFYAAGVSMGLLGVITSVTLQCVPRYDVLGEERTTDYGHCEIDLFGRDATGNRPGVQTFLEQAEHSRLLWWPQPGVEKVTVWKARKVDPDPNRKRQPYRQVRRVLGSSYPAYLLISLALKAVDSLNPPAPRGWMARRAERLLAQMYKLIAGQFLRPSRQQFCDSWWQALPMDDQTNYSLLPTSFTELWIPLAHSTRVMQSLREHYAAGFPATGTYACEIYASPASMFWMSPAYGRPVIRIDPFWFNKSKIDPLQYYYPQYWSLLRDFGYTLHWGKALSGDEDYIQSGYPKWGEFMALRAELDPSQVFVTDYWRKHLAVAST